ncbi:MULTISPECIES: NAD(P)H-dependent oxidoreductase [Eikenella]|uniref:NAD(P)H dehydrogenase n=1 Tax=Eikenella longinqua TaxID=1795827 RepID=A0A1A9RXA6_9NEIS|nr:MULTISPECIES: NAD(P)H-dependent oxidoreductase [Eikenella]OAM26776.1 NAD(P)H dehydrogenase [Eikenella longinqua]
MQNILIVSGHPDLQNSIANAEILAEAAKALPNAEIRKLDALYPERRFNIEAEQSALLQADVIVLQFPFSWYSVPGLMKLWIDEVFVFGFAHGEGAKLAGKKLIVSFTTGAPAAAYQRDGFFQHTVEDYLPQFETTAALCNLNYQGAIYTCGIGYISRDNEAAVNAQKQEARQHAERLIAKIKEIAT